MTYVISKVILQLNIAPASCQQPVSVAVQMHH